MLGNLLRNKTSSSGFEKSSEHSDFSSVVPNVPVYCKAASTGTTKTAAGALLDTAVNVEKPSEMLSTTSPPILDHISDDLKLKLFGSRIFLIVVLSIRYKTTEVLVLIKSRLLTKKRMHSGF